MSVGHIGIYVQPGDLDNITKWYLDALAPLGFKVHTDLRPAHQVIGIGARWPNFWIAVDPNAERPTKEKLHIAFDAKNRQEVRDFYACAMKAGAKCNGPPGLRPHYASTYYGAFVLDPEGRNIEAVCLWPGILAEPKSWNAIVATIVLAVGVGVGYFTGLSSYLL